MFCLEEKKYDAKPEFTYPTEFRQQMLELVALDRCPKQLSKEFGCHYTLIQV